MKRFLALILAALMLLTVASACKRDPATESDLFLSDSKISSKADDSSSEDVDSSDASESVGEGDESQGDADKPGGDDKAPTKSPDKDPTKAPDKEPTKAPTKAPDQPSLKITKQPSNAKQSKMNPVTFTITVSGEGVKYQWQEEVDGGNGLILIQTPGLPMVRK